MGATINFFATRGTLSAPTAVTDSGGDARVTIRSDNAGPAVITANTNIPGGPSAQVSIQFVAVTPDSLTLQADPTLIGVNAEGSTDEQSIITAVVRDPNDNPVANKTVSFNLTDPSGCSISPASAITDAFGRATTVYTAGLTPSASEGVVINASVVRTPTSTITARVTLTVARQSLFITLGTSQFIGTPTPTQYAKPYTVLVTDADGNPVSGRRVTLSVLPTRYEKGTYEPFFDVVTGGFLGWGKQRSISPATGFADDSDLACDNEDLDRDGIRDVGEDVNNNRRLDPGNVATVDPPSVTTDDSGFGSFDVLYAREFTWVEVALEASTIVGGSEFLSRAVFFLPGLADDFNNLLIPPPGRVSPFGVATTCACSELSEPTCPVSAGPVTIIPAEVTVPVGGDIVEFDVIGGTQSSYTVTTTDGVLTNTVTTQSGRVITVNFGEAFTLTTGPSEDGTTITITAIDDITAQEGTAIVTQEALPPVRFSPPSATLSSAGTPPVSFEVTGGTDTTYTVTIASGPAGAGLSDSDETDETTITVDSGETFTLSAPPNTEVADLTITLVAQDDGDPTLPQATAEVTQLAP